MMNIIIIIIIIIIIKQRLTRRVSIKETNHRRGLRDCSSCWKRKYLLPSFVEIPPVTDEKSCHVKYIVNGRTDGRL